jgi:hypothetical protein
VTGDRPYHERPAARPSAPDGPPSEPVPKKGGGCLTVLAVLGGITVLLIVVVIVVNVVNSAARQSQETTPDDMLRECSAIIVDWAQVDPSEVTGQDVNDENFTGAGWDFRGTYPGGEWACGGLAGDEQPSSVFVYPGGADSTDPADIPQEIFPQR